MGTSPGGGVGGGAPAVVVGAELGPLALDPPLVVVDPLEVVVVELLVVEPELDGWLPGPVPVPVTAGGLDGPVVLLAGESTVGSV